MHFPKQKKVMIKRKLRGWQDFIKMTISWHWTALEVQGKIYQRWNLHPWKDGGSMALGAPENNQTKLC